MKEAASKGARVAEDLEELCGSSEVIISMLPGTRDVVELYTATNGGVGKLGPRCIGAYCFGM